MQLAPDGVEAILSFLERGDPNRAGEGDPKSQVFVSASILGAASLVSRG